MDIPRRKNIRLIDYDYSRPGGYYITICTHEKKCILSHIESDARAQAVLTELGQIAQEVLAELPGAFGFRLDAYVIMPNHIHLILMKDAVQTGKSVGQLIGAFKSIVTNRWCQICDANGITAGKLWQRNYYDHILRNEADYIEKRKYIEENPDKWRLDEYR